MNSLSCLKAKIVQMEDLLLKSGLDKIAEFDDFTDERDGRYYLTVKIKGITWMAENLKYAGKNNDIGVCYDGKPENGDKYGRLYDFETAKKACPIGWNLPCKKEWEKLINFFGSPDSKDLKATLGWNSNRTNAGTDTAGTDTADDTLGFAALPGGYCDSNGVFHDLGRIGYWWSNCGNSGNAYRLGIFYTYSDIPYIDSDKNYLYSVRCVKDD